MTPRVSVIMTVYNGARHLDEAIASVLTQTLTDFEFLIVDDCSTDATPERLRAAEAGDPRIRILWNETNLGPYPSANRALEEARAPIIARMDADDISEPERLERQVAALEERSERVLVGSGYRSIDDEGRTRYIRRNPMNAFATRWVTRFRMPMVHPCFCFRAVTPDGWAARYPGDASVAQDYAMAAELTARGEGVVLGEALVRYRMHGSNISSTRLGEQQRAAIAIARKALAADLGRDTVARFEPFLDVLYRQRPAQHGDLRASVTAFRVLIDEGGATPARRAWMRRRAAGMLAEAFFGAGTAPARLSHALQFVLAAPDFGVPLLGRVAELRGWVRPDPAP